MRQGGNDPRQAAFRDLLMRLRDNSSSNADYQMLVSRTKERATNIPLFEQALRLFPTNMKVNEHNIKKIGVMNQPIARIDAVHSGKGASAAPEKEAGNLQRVLYLCKGAQVMLTSNLSVKHGLVNGSIGHVTELIYAADSRPPSLPVSVNVRFRDYPGPTLPNGAVPICPKISIFELGSTQCSRLQLPLKLAWAVSIHKSQGMTLDRVVLDLGDCDFSPGLSYVALSRVRSIDDILFESTFVEERLSKSSSVALHKRLAEEERLGKMSSHVVSPTNSAFYPIPAETKNFPPNKTKAAKVIRNQPQKGPKANGSNTTVFESTSDLNNLQRGNFQISYQIAQSIMMNESRYNYYPADEGWQHLVCNTLGLRFVRTNGCMPGAPNQPISTPSTVIPIEGDGACLFRSLSHLITGSQEQHHELRQMVCDHSLNEEVSAWLDPLGFYRAQDTNVASHIQGMNMRAPTAWATSTEIFSASDLLKTQILTADAGNHTWFVFGPRHRTFGEFSANEMSIYINYVPFSGTKGTCNHYEVVRSVFV